MFGTSRTLSKKERCPIRAPGKERRMYIPEFWCGVGATLFVEVCLLVGIAIYQNRKRK